MQTTTAATFSSKNTPENCAGNKQEIYLHASDPIQCLPSVTWPHNYTLNIRPLNVHILFELNVSVYCTQLLDFVLNFKMYN